MYFLSVDMEPKREEKTMHGSSECSMLLYGWSSIGMGGVTLLESERRRGGG